MMIAVWEATTRRDSSVGTFCDLEELLGQRLPKDWPTYVIVPTVFDHVFEKGWPEATTDKEGVVHYSLRMYDK